MDVKEEYLIQDNQASLLIVITKDNVQKSFLLKVLRLLTSIKNEYFLEAGKLVFIAQMSAECELLRPDFFT